MDEYNGCAGTSLLALSIPFRPVQDDFSTLNYFVDASYELSHLSFLWESDHQQRAGIAIYEKHSGNLIFGSIPCKEYELPWIIEW